jgi:DNA-binding PadR family transcriptional regulator
MMPDPVSRHFFNGFIRLHILYHASKSPVFGAEITEELIRHGYRLSQGTLYPTLHLLEGLGYVHSRVQLVGGKRRKYYRATPAGRKVLKEARERLEELILEVLEDHKEPFQKLRQKRNSTRRNNRSKTSGKGRHHS